MQRRPASSFLCAALFALQAAVALAQGIPTAAARHLFDFAGGGAGALSLPTDVAVGNGGRVYVVDGGNHRVVAFSNSGQYLFRFGHQGSGKGEFRDPVGIGTDGQGRVYVADSGNHRIQVFDSSGGFLNTFAVSEGGKPVRPIDVEPDGQGKTLFVTGNNNHKVMTFSASGQLLRQWGGEGVSDFEFRYPATMALSPKGLLYVVDVLNTRVQVFDGDGRRGFRVGGWGVLPGQFFRPKGVALDSRGFVYVSDSYLEVIQVFDTSYRLQHVLGDAGKPRRFSAPVGLAIDGGDRLYVVEMLANKVSVHALR
ncbi:MAG: NHL repeat-containing protein [Betaproteobacteria bacterium]|nr:NHL repeat-containing protein [Betaproteobacteria bacterium]